MTCCHISSTSASPTTGAFYKKFTSNNNNTKSSPKLSLSNNNKLLSDLSPSLYPQQQHQLLQQSSTMLNNNITNQLCCPNCSNSMIVPINPNRYANGYGWNNHAGIYGINGTLIGGVGRRQQFGRWHEEPTFGSRYAFTDKNNENHDPNSKSNNKSTKKHHKQQKQKSKKRKKKKKLSSLAAANAANDNDEFNDVNNFSSTDIDSGSDSSTSDNGVYSGDDHDHRNHLFMNDTCLIKSSSIDTIAVSLIYFKFYFRK